VKAFVTGATGFIGSHVARMLRDAGWEVRCLARPSSSRELLDGVDVEWIEGDVCDLDSLRKGAEGCDGLFHVAALYALWSGEPERFTAVNVEGTRNALTAAKEAGVRRVVYTSSVACVGEAPPGGLADEDTPANPGDLVGPYKRSKYEAEQVALEAAAAGQDVVIVNPSSTIGPGDHGPTPTGKIILDFLEGRMPAYLDTGLNFVDVRDVARGHLLAFEKGQSGRRYILGNREGNLSLKDFLALLGEVSGKKPPRFKIPYGVAWMAGAVSTATASLTGKPPGIPLDGVLMAKHRMFFDPSRAVSELGLPQTPVRLAVSDAVAWFREHGKSSG
jgi:dihydroflavonol-4-reductase